MTRDDDAGARRYGRLDSREMRESTIAAAWGELLGVSRIDRDANLFDIGADSLVVVRFLSRLSRVGVTFTSRQVYEHPTIADLAAIVDPDDAATVLPSYEYPATPAESAFLEALPGFVDRNVTMRTLLSENPLDPDVLRVALLAVIDHHDGLRARIQSADGNLFHRTVPSDPEAILEVVDLRAAGSDATRAFHEIGVVLRRRVKISQGAPIRAVLGLLPDGVTQLHVAVSHLVCDGVSWGVLCEDLETAYGAAEGREQHRLPRTTPLSGWATKQSEYASRREVLDDLPYWTRPELRGRALPSRLPGPTAVTMEQLTDRLVTARRWLDHPSGAGHRRLRFRVERLATALALAVRNVTGATTLVLGVTSVGRNSVLEPVDLARTVGWMNNFYPQLLEIGNLAPAAALEQVTDQMHRVPNAGMSYGVLRFLSPRRSIRQQLHHPDPQLGLNVFDTEPVSRAPRLLRLAEASSEPTPRSTRVRVAVSRTERATALEWTFNEHFYEAAMINRIADAHVAALRELDSPSAEG